MDDFFKFLSPRIKARKSLGRLNQAIFSCLLNPVYPDNIYIFEHRIHQYKREFMLSCHPEERSLRRGIFRIFDAMMNYSQIRWRLTDFSVLEICQQELKELEKAIDNWIMEKHDKEQVEKALQKFEEIYQNVVQVTSPDALAFLLFINGVRGLPRHCEVRNTEAIQN